MANISLFQYKFRSRFWLLQPQRSWRDCCARGTSEPPREASGEAARDFSLTYSQPSRGSAVKSVLTTALAR